MQTQLDYVIVGGGCMGVSTALALQRRWPDAKIVMFEGSEPTTASKGVCRIIRTPYQDKEYVSLAEDAKAKWEKELPYRDFYRRNGWIQVVLGQDYTPFHSQERLIKAEYLKRMVQARDPPLLDAEENLWLNEDIGVADAALALEAVAAQAATLGVIRAKKDISKLRIENGDCRGVELIDGSSIMVKTTILATGPWTPALLKNSAVPLPGVQHNFFEVTAVNVATLPLIEDEYTKFKSMPILTTKLGMSIFI
jgi:sarcosine oxidase/L-pipecolate oxidase